METKQMPSVDELMAAVSEYGQLRWSEAISAGHYDKMGERQASKDADEALESIRALATRLAAPVQPQAPSDVEPEFYTVFGEHEGGWIPLPGYSNETERGVKDFVLQTARKEGYKGTAEGRLFDLGWRIGPVYAAPMPAPQAPRMLTMFELLHAKDNHGTHETEDESIQRAFMRVNAGLTIPAGLKETTS
jgi:hypothetical protein